jgi:hypothetical protein
MDDRDVKEGQLLRGMMSDRARVIFELPGLEKYLLDSKYPNLKMVQRLAGVLKKDFFDPEASARVIPDVSVAGMDTPRWEMLNFMADWLVLDLERLGKNEVLAEIEKATHGYDKLRRSTGSGDAVDGFLRSVNTEMEMLAKGTSNPVPDKLIEEATRNVAGRLGGVVDKDGVASGAKDFLMGIVGIMTKGGEWWDEILQNPETGM